MTTNFPGGLDDFVNPAGTSLLTNPDHAGQHTDLNDAVEALEAKVGVNGSLVTSSIDYKLANDVVLKSVVDAKGDLIAGTASDAVARLGVGADDTVLMARASESTGLAWGAPRLAGGGARPLLTGGARLSGSGLVLSGLTANYASSPDSAALSITGDIDIKVKVALTDWTPSSAQILVGKWVTTGNQRSYQFYVNSGANSGRLSFDYSTDGSNFTVTNSTTTTGITDGSIKWVRVTQDGDDGGGNRVTKFYTSDDGTIWTQLGTTVTTAGTRTMFDSTAVLETGSNIIGTNANVSGTIYRVIIQSAFDTANNTTSLVYDANFETATADALAFTETANSATVTINTTRYFVGLPEIGHISTATRAVNANQDWYEPFRVVAPITVIGAAFEVTTAPSTTSTFYLALYAADGNLQPTGSPVVTWSAITVATSTTAVYYADITPTTLNPGVYVLAANPSVTFTCRSYRTPGWLQHSLGSSGIVTRFNLARTAAAFSTAGSWNVRDVAAVGFDPFVFLRWRAA